MGRIKKDDLDINLQGKIDNVDSNTTNLTALQEQVDSQLADYTLQIPYSGITTGVANTYAISTPTITTMPYGIAVSVKINIASTGASTLNWCGLGAKPIVRPNLTSFTNLKAGGVYTFRYVDGFFILQGEGGSGNAIASDLLTGKTASTDAGDVTGTMANIASPTTTLTTQGATKVIAAGYNPGGTITASITNLSAANAKNGIVVGGITGTSASTTVSASAPSGGFDNDYWIQP